MNAAPSFPPLYLGPRSPLLAVRDELRAYFLDAGVPGVVAEVGLKYRSFALNQNPATNANRVVLIPGEFKAEPIPKPRKYGTLDRATREHASVVNPREIWHWDRPVTLSLWSAPAPGHSEDESLSIALAEDLLEQVARGLLPFGGSILLGEVTINAPPVEGGFGAELLVAMMIRGPLFDRTHDIAAPVASVPVRHMA